MAAKTEDTSARTFLRNGFYERLIGLRTTDPKTFNSISPASKLGLFHYEASKRQHEAEQQKS